MKKTTEKTQKNELDVTNEGYTATDNKRRKTENNGIIAQIWNYIFLPLQKILRLVSLIKGLETF